MPNNISNTYKRKSIRLKDYDYSLAGLYYVTICCYNKQHLFGDIENNQMKMNKCGEIANECWINIPTHYPNAKLHEYVIMPNHIHGIIELLDDHPKRLAL